MRQFHRALSTNKVQSVRIRFLLVRLTYTTTAIVEQTVRDYITCYYSIRIQTKLNNQSPVNFRRLAA